MAEAIILVNAETGILTSIQPNLSGILEEISDLNGVQKAALVTGPYDIAAWLEADSMDRISRTLIEKIRTIDGVKRTITLVVTKSK